MVGEVVLWVNKCAHQESIQETFPSSQGSGGTQHHSQNNFNNLERKKKTKQNRKARHGGHSCDPRARGKPTFFQWFSGSHLELSHFPRQHDPVAV